MNTNQKTAEELKETVRQKYSQISDQAKDYNTRSCCGAGGESDEVYNITVSYTHLTLPTKRIV